MTDKQLPTVTTPDDIVQQRAKGWPDFHPEDFCHRCGRSNVCWFVASPLWNAANIEDETPSGIVCPACFVAAFEREVPDATLSWELKPDPGTLDHLPDELRVEEAAWRDAFENGRLSEYHANRESRESSTGSQK